MTYTNNVSIPEALKVAYAHYRADRIPQAKTILERILAADADNPRALYMLGLIFIQSGRYRSAAELIGRAIAARGDIPDFHAKQGEVYRVLEDFDQSVACYRRAIELTPGDALIRANLAGTFLEAGQLREAEVEYEAACRLTLENQRRLEDLATRLERGNQTLGARLVVKRGLDRYPESIWLRLLDAKLDRLEGFASEAASKLEALLGQVGAERDIGIALRFELGMAYDRAGDVDKAFGVFSLANAMRYKSAEMEGFRRGESVQLMRQTFEAVKPQWVSSWMSVPIRFERRAPVFLVGFPRSGTTLLEQITGSHSGICTAEEKPFVAMLQDRLTKEYGYPDGLAKLTPEGINCRSSDLI